MEKNKENKIADEKLLSAVTQGNVSGLFRALEDGANIDCRVNSGQTPLIAAAESKNAEIASILLKNGADPNFSDVIYQTPLMRAVQGGAVDVAKLLINSGASVDKKDAEGYTVLLQLCAEPLEQKS
ncbi:MAG: ankyrin repeat domain-containing protein, partial [Candidatus Micrarchaeota archaeon]|nr:ankyrin repeat domain-containing protein [Candidatus Micrarchaeota archaeon]